MLFYGQSLYNGQRTEQGFLVFPRYCKSPQLFVMRLGCAAMDFVSSARYCNISADLGNRIGKCNYGYCLSRGAGIDQDLRSAARCYKTLADLGDLNGMFWYGHCLFNGQGVEQDFVVRVLVTEKYPLISGIPWG
jgi:TPR repeat protein